MKPLHKNTVGTRENYSYDEISLCGDIAVDMNLSLNYMYSMPKFQPNTVCTAQL